MSIGRKGRMRERVNVSIPRREGPGVRHQKRLGILRHEANSTLLVVAECNCRV